jgi:hypothetical protein
LHNNFIILNIMSKRINKMKTVKRKFGFAYSFGD